MSKKKFQPNVGEALNVREFRTGTPLVRADTILLFLLVTGVVALLITGLYGFIVSDFSYIEKLWSELDWYFAFIIGGLVGKKIDRFEKSEFSDGS